MKIDESNDISETALVEVFVRAINDNFVVIEELLGLEALHSSIRGSDLNNMEWVKFVSICIDRAPAMMVDKSGCPSLLEHSNAPNPREFRQFLSDMTEEFGPLLMHCELDGFPKERLFHVFWHYKIKFICFFLILIN
ncbi:hypothetical protein RF11_05546 [Thelohanellus kitauei]|uniref:General transcription factor II-I repeat domain-containing protein 2 n=1 Tax=Thelohanellus kitauei TaxID=669202 RepID=A0A0C2MU36_THEKT|nr:hypothetical protein RF11_05546 [Thelohanellus kitauei]